MRVRRTYHDHVAIAQVLVFEDPMHRRRCAHDARRPADARAATFSASSARETKLASACRPPWHYVAEVARDGDAWGERGGGAHRRRREGVLQEDWISTRVNPATSILAVRTKL